MLRLALPSILRYFIDVLELGKGIDLMDRPYLFELRISFFVIFIIVDFGSLPFLII